MGWMTKWTRTPARKVAPRPVARSVKKVATATVGEMNKTTKVDDDQEPLTDFPTIAPEKKGVALRYKKAGWYIPQKDGDGFLAGLRCQICKKGFRKDTSVWAQSITEGRYGTKVYIGFHAPCMAAAAKEAPAERWEEIRDQLASGKGLFE